MRTSVGRNTYGRFAVCISFVCWLSGCSTLPAFGPSSDTVIDAAKHLEAVSSDFTEFQLINISPSTIPVSTSDQVRKFPFHLSSQEFLSSNQKVVPGDVVQIRMWEATGDGLFATGGKRETEFTLRVSNSGTMDVPYAGTISVVDESVQEIRKVLLERYRGIAIDPEINVEIKETKLRGVSVLGAVASPGWISIPAEGIKLLDVIALSGGIPHPDWEVVVKVERRDVSASLGLVHVFDDPKNNIIILPNDNIAISHRPQRVAVYGAISKPGLISVNTASPRLSDVLAESGGLNDMKAEAGSVFVFRVSEYGNRTASIAYRLDFTRPDAFILASQFTIVSSDIVYVAASDASEFQKFVNTLFSPILVGAGNVQDIAN